MPDRIGSLEQASLTVPGDARAVRSDSQILLPGTTGSAAPSHYNTAVVEIAHHPDCAAVGFIDIEAVTAAGFGEESSGYGILALGLPVGPAVGRRPFCAARLGNSGNEEAAIVSSAPLERSCLVVGGIDPGEISEMVIMTDGAVRRMASYLAVGETLGLEAA
ncbi:MAG: hypothetical protein AB7W16_12525, partial [Candidatus Obscuribacterales bacterium]